LIWKNVIPADSSQEFICAHGFSIKDFGNDDYCSYYLLGLHSCIECRQLWPIFTTYWAIACVGKAKNELEEYKMALAQEDIEQIQELIKKSIESTPEVGNANVRYELDLRERTIRVEEELKHQRELMLTGFAQMEKRFEQVDKRFEQMHEEFNKRFEQVDKHFEKIDKQLEKQSQAIMDIHQEIKQQMRWSFGVLVTIGGLVVGVLKLTS